MANELRVRANFLNGTLVAGISNADTALSSMEIANLPTIDSSQHLMLVLDPGATGGAPEIVKVIYHATSSTGCSVLRAQEGTVARAHGAGTRWAHTPLVSDPSYATGVLHATAEMPGSGTAGSVTPGSSAGPALRAGRRSSLASYATGNNSYLGDNVYYDGTSWRCIENAPGAVITYGAGGFILRTFPAPGAAGGVVTLSEVMSITAAGAAIFAGLITANGGITTSSGITANGGFGSTGARSTLRVDSSETPWYGGLPLLLENGTTGPRLGFHQPGKVASSFGQITNSESYRTYDNSGAGYTNLTAYNLYNVSGVMTGYRARGSYTGNGTNGRFFGLGFQPLVVVIWNRNWMYHHIGYNTWQNGDSYGRYEPNGNTYYHSGNGYRPWVADGGFHVDASILNNNGTLYDWYAWG